MTSRCGRWTSTTDSCPEISTRHSRAASRTRSVCAWHQVARVDASANHPFLTLDGWQPVEDLVVGSRIASARRIPEASAPPSGMSDQELILLGHLIGDGCTLRSHALQYTTIDPANVEAVRHAALWFGVQARPKAERTWTQVYLPEPVSAHARQAPSDRRVVATTRGVGTCARGRSCVPAAVFAEAPDRVALFLRHLWATDGSVTVPSGSRSTTDLLRDLEPSAGR